MGGEESSCDVDGEESGAVGSVVHGKGGSDTPTVLLSVLRRRCCRKAQSPRSLWQTYAGLHRSQMGRGLVN